LCWVKWFTGGGELEQVREILSVGQSRDFSRSRINTALILQQAAQFHNSEMA